MHTSRQIKMEENKDQNSNLPLPFNLKERLQDRICEHLHHHHRLVFLVKQLSLENSSSMDELFQKERNFQRFHILLEAVQFTPQFWKRINQKKG